MRFRRRPYGFFRTTAVSAVLSVGCSMEDEADLLLEGTTGACCTDDGCDVSNSMSCVNEGGTWLADKACFGAFPACRGACCRDDSCFVAAHKTECEEIGGEFKGLGTNCDDGLSCPEDPPDSPVDSELVSVCCLGESCVEISPDECAGTLRLDVDSCSEVDCSKGACCDSLLEDCEETSRNDCIESAFSEFAGSGTTCAETDCANGACCSPDGATCLDTSEEQCAISGHAFKGVGTTCDRQPCLTMPCCTIDQTCTEETPESCRANGGSVLPENQDCFKALPCSVGLCCALFPSDENFGDCGDDFTQGSCEGQGGTFAGLGLTCTENTFEGDTHFRITDISNDPATGLLGETKFALHISWVGNPTFPIRVQGFLDTLNCPDDQGFCPIVTRRVDFQVEENLGLIVIDDWNECPGIFNSVGFVEPWRFRILDRHCVASNETPLVLRCAP